MKVTRSYIEPRTRKYFKLLDFAAKAGLDAAKAAS